MNAINWTGRDTTLEVVWKTQSCPITGSDHGPFDLNPDPDDEEELHYYVECLSCNWTGSAGVFPHTKKIELFYEWGRKDFKTGDNFIWTDETGTEHPHTKQPVIQTSGKFKGQLWWGL